MKEIDHINGTTYVICVSTCFAIFFMVVFLCALWRC